MGDEMTDTFDRERLAVAGIDRAIAALRETAIVEDGVVTNPEQTAMAVVDAYAPEGAE